MDYSLFVLIEDDWITSIDLGFPVWQQGFAVVIFDEVGEDQGPIQTWG